MALIESLLMNMLCVPVGPLQANCYLIWDDLSRACAVDPGGEPERLASIVQDRGLRLDAILVTHGHFDHVEGVAGLSEATGAMIYCSEPAGDVLLRTNRCSASGYPVAGVPDTRVQIIEDGSTVKVGSLEVTVIATPGHTPGDVTYSVNGALFCGDLLFRGSVGRTDFPGGDFTQLISSVGRLVDSFPLDTPVYPGHMEATSLEQELRHNPFLAGMRSDG